MNSDRKLREYLVWLLQDGRAHVSFDRAFAGIPPDLRGARLQGVPHTLWRLLEHMRLCQWDILEFCRNRYHLSPDFPQGYWPQDDAPPDEQTWDASLKAFGDDRKAMQGLIADPANDLFRPVAHGPKHTLLEQALILADHNSYHLGQAVTVRRALACWDD